jgi:hypothetical protein
VTPVVYEARHRELRKAVGPGDDARPLLERQVALWSFDERTGPLVDDVVAAARRLVGSIGTLALSRALDQLDEESARA